MGSSCACAAVHMKSIRRGSIRPHIFLLQHEQTRLTSLREAEERLSECTKIIQLIEMKISESMHNTSKLEALLTKMQDNETALKNIKIKLANASIVF